MKLKVYTSRQKMELQLVPIAAIMCLSPGIVAIAGAELVMVALYLFIAIFTAPIFIISLLRVIRYSHHVIVDTAAIRSYNVFGKLLCTVDMNRCVYYAHYDHYVPMKGAPPKFEARYCMLSNEIFLYRHEVGKKLSEPMDYDVKKVLVIKIDKTSEPYLYLDDWVQLDG